jgi:hypothetical protein
MQVGEVDRARAIYVHASSLSDPRNDPGFWKDWNDFEVRRRPRPESPLYHYCCSLCTQFMPLEAGLGSMTGGTPSGQVQGHSCSPSPKAPLVSLSLCR